MSRTINPDWYWSAGLHDAKIISVTETQSPRNPEERQLIIKLDGDWAIYERDIREIRLLGYRVKTKDFNLSTMQGGFWLWDDLTRRGDRFHMELAYDTAKCKTRHVTLTFDNAEVIREREGCMNDIHKKQSAIKPPDSSWTARKNDGLFVIR